MVMIFGTLVSNDDISRLCFLFFKILIFWVVSGLKGQKTIQNDKILSIMLHISGNIDHTIVIYSTHV